MANAISRFAYGAGTMAPEDFNVNQATGQLPDAYNASQPSNLAALLANSRKLRGLGFNGATTLTTPNSNGQQWDAGTQSVNPEFEKWLADNGYSVRGDLSTQNGMTASLLDPSGQIVDSGSSGNDNRFWNAALAAGAAVGASAYGAGGAAGGALDAGSPLGIEGATYAMPEAGGGLAYTGADAVGAGTVGNGITGTLGGAGAGLTGAARAAGARGGTAGLGDWALIGSSLIGGALQSSAAKSAAQTQANATNAATAAQQAQADRAYADQAPYRAAGNSALGQLQAGLSTPTTAADVMADPGYQFGLDQGQQAIDRKIAAGGGRVSGQAIKAAARFGTNYASTGYSAANQRREDRLARLQTLAGLGQSATSSSAASGANAANQISSLTSAQGNATGAGQISQGNIWADTGNQIAALYRRGQPKATAPTSPYANYGGDYNSLEYRP